MKLVILTVNDFFNYGNRLQNYALQELLIQQGHEPKTLKNYYSANDNFFKSYVQKYGIYKPLLLFKSLLNFKDYQRKRNFFKFTNSYIKETSEVVTKFTSIPISLNNYDAFVIGSDQVWNYNFPRFSEYDFALYTDKPVISFAASFGIDYIPDNLRDLYIKGLSHLMCISVREEKGKYIVSNLIGTESQVVLDPTLLLSKNHWLSLCDSESQVREKYILTYFLDKPTTQVHNYINNIAKKNEWVVYELNNSDDSERWTCGPTEFLQLFKNSMAVFTDSFHACVFSIIFEKKFEVFERNTHLPSMNSRIETLLFNLNLSYRLRKKNNKNFEISLGKINYKEVNFLLEGLRSKSMKYLKKSLEEIEHNVQGNYK